MGNRIVLKQAMLATGLLAMLSACSGDDPGAGVVIGGETVQGDSQSDGNDGDTGKSDTNPGLEIPVALDTGDTGDDTTGTEFPEFFGKPCADNSQCTDGVTDGYCFDDGTEKACTIQCTENCPEGYGCVGVQLGGSDPTLICVKKTSTNCNTCAADVDCIYPGAKCIEIGKDGGQPDMRCAMDCSQGQPCGEGYQCVAQAPVDGASAAQLCVPTTESCICDALLDGTSRQCSKSQEGVGTCYGQETCDGPDGWTGCTAAEPLAEQCNLADDDCDGKTDETEDLVLDPCTRKNDFGECAGTEVCSGSQEECSAQEPQAETCNGKDDDCDDETDEGQLDSDLDGKCDDTDDDDDGDGAPDASDNCPYTKNIDQKDTDNDGVGDACDGDCDADGVSDETDNCKCKPNDDQKDYDKDLIGDKCDPDADGDGVEPPDDCNDFEAAAFKGAPEICDGIDNNCNNIGDEGFPDTDGDFLKDCLDPDDDNDGDPDGTDCNPLDAKISHTDAELCDGVDNDCDTEIDEGFPDFDEDDICDAIDPDIDNDGYLNANDNCPTVPNNGQANNDSDKEGDVCDLDDDNDDVEDTIDNCPKLANTSQTDTDGDNAGDECDSDDDGDGKIAGVGSDCNDKDASIYVGATEICDNKDNDCNDAIDEGFPDKDGDFKHDCVDDDDDGDGFTDAFDCQPLVAAINPDADEACDGIDNNCLGGIDEGCPPTSVSLIFPSAVITGTTASGLNVMLTVGVPGVVGRSAPASGTGYSVDWGFYYTLP